MRHRYLIPLATIALLILGLAARTASADTVGTNAPDFDPNAAWSDGETRAIEDFEGRVLLIHFLSRSCWDAR